ncbi:MAG: hypothetical protein HC843_11015 [Sphingomonadales bacterium]|nr:hypothetical protein [Sphingomonadales bacterium]
MSDSDLTAEVEESERSERTSHKIKKKLLGEIDPNLFAEVPVQINAILGRGKMDFKKLSSLSEDDVIDLDTALNGEVDLMLGDKVIANGEIVSIDDHFAVRITNSFIHK